MHAAGVLWEILFPTRCVSCRTYGDWWCDACRGAIEVLARDLCHRCGKRRAADHECEGTDALDGLAACGYYHDPRLRAVIQAIKYKGATRVAERLVAFLRAWRDARIGPWPWAGVARIGIQPLVAGPRRVRARGFDQSALLAGMFRDAVLPWGEIADLLEREDAEVPQVSLKPGNLREANVSGTFRVRTDARVPPHIVLVDDVLTTGSTMREAARILKQAGAERVYGFALAIGA